jgi:peptidoglycan hydrolase-like protein with peptidoglycan-binding domain
VLLRHTRRTLVLAVLALGVAVLLGSPALAALMNPTSPVAAPAKVESLSPYLPQVSCDPVAKPGTEALRTLLLETYGGRDLGITRNCSIGATSEHKEGRAFDWGLNVTVPAEKAIADQFLGWLLATGLDGTTAYNARRLGVMYVIWNGRIWGSYGAGWKAYSGAEAHTDHIHISLSWAGAMKTTSFWTGTAAATDYGPCRAYVGLPADRYTAPRTSPSCPPAVAPMTLTESPLLSIGATGPYVAQLQTWLKVTVDGAFGPKTAQALVAFQTTAGLPATGTTDPATWVKLRTPAAASAPTPKPTPSATPSPAPTPTPTAAPAPKPTPVVVLPTPKPVAAPVNRALAPYAGLTLKQGARGAAVVALQKALHVTADGAFGPKTAAAVTAFNKVHKLRADAVVRPATWAALGAPASRPGKAPAKARRWVPAAA